MRSWLIAAMVVFRGGNNDDTVLLTVDGTTAPMQTGALEEYYRVSEPGTGRVPVQCRLFRVSNPATALMGGGLLFDDVATWLESTT